jgi:cytochrome b561
MQAANSETRWGWVAIVLHWLVALAIIGLFALGFWMVDLTYYDDWYRQAPDIHRSVGILLFATMLFRVIWRLIHTPPAPLLTHTRLEVIGAKVGHLALYLLIFVAMISGYLISTADGSAIAVFGWFEVPSVTGRIKGLEDPAGAVHYWATWVLIVLAGLHALAALKHHFIDRDDTLRRMLGRSPGGIRS